MPDAHLLTLGRPSLGEAGRIRSWERILTSAGYDVHKVTVTDTERTLRRATRNAFGTAVNTIRGAAVPEAAVWHPRTLDLAGTDLIVASTARAWHPHLVGMGRQIILDLVDSLATSYRQRAELESGFTAHAYRVLSPLHRRFESNARYLTNVHLVATGYTEAAMLGATWVPITCEAHVGSRSHERQRRLGVFTGTLSYAPNVDGLRQLRHLWPDVQQRVPGAGLIVAGRGPNEAVRQMVDANPSWDLLADFMSLDEVLDSAEVALVPLRRATGQQTKVLDAAQRALPQLLTPAARAGYDPDFPVPATPIHLFASRLVDHARGSTALIDEAARARAHVEREYSAERWADRVTTMLR